jgi:2-keto-4-pentenoate hydratase
VTDRPAGASQGPDPLAVAEELRRAEQQVCRVGLLTHRFGDRFAWSDARSIAREVDRFRIGEADSQVGYKLGWTSAAMREALGIEQPNWGTIWQSQEVVGSLDLDDLILGKVEPELVCRLDADVSMSASIEEVAAACAEWTVGLEVVAPRFGSFEFEFLDNTADNSSAARFAVGEFVRPAVDPATIDVAFSEGGVQRVGHGSAAMGSPLVAVHWLVGALAQEGSVLESGQIVFTGGLTAPFDLRGGLTLTASSEALGVQVRLSCVRGSEAQR